MMSSEQFFNFKLNTYPTLYVGATKEISMFKVLDWLFNMQPSLTFQEFCEILESDGLPEWLLETPPEKYLSDNHLYIFNRKPKHEGNLISNKDLFLWDELNKKEDCILYKRYESYLPYPSFKKEKSFIWFNYQKLTIDWLKTALWFYNECEIILSGYKKIMTQDDVQNKNSLSVESMYHNQSYLKNVLFFVLETTKLIKSEIKKREETNAN